jgi:hypothetical protein
MFYLLFPYLIFDLSQASAEPLNILPLLQDDIPVGLIGHDRWVFYEDNSLNGIPINNDITAAFYQDGSTLYVSDKQLWTSDDMGCQTSQNLDIIGEVKQLEPDNLGRPWLLLSHDNTQSQSNWLIYQSFNGGKNWAVYANLLGDSASLSTHELGWDILINDGSNWILNRHSGSAGTPKEFTISISGQLELLASSTENILLQSRTFQSDVFHGSEIQRRAELWLWNSDETQQKIVERENEVYWIQGILGHNHGIYALDSNQALININNDFIIESGSAGCIWKSMTSEALWTCSVESSGYQLWQTLDGIDWMGWMDTTSMTQGECSEYNSDPNKSDTQGCSSLYSTPGEDRLVLLFLCLPLILRRYSVQH